MIVVGSIAEVRCAPEEFRLSVLWLFFTVTATFVHPAFGFFMLNFQTRSDGCQIIGGRLRTLYWRNGCIWKCIRTVWISSGRATKATYSITCTIKINSQFFFTTQLNRSLAFDRRSNSCSKTTFTRENLYWTGYCSHYFFNAQNVNLLGCSISKMLSKIIASRIIVIARNGMK